MSCTDGGVEITHSKPETRENSSIKAKSRTKRKLSPDMDVVESDEKNDIERKGFSQNSKRSKTQLQTVGSAGPSKGFPSRSVARSKSSLPLPRPQTTPFAAVPSDLSIR